MEITREVAKKVLAIVDAGLVNGLGKAEPGKMCVEAAVCFALGLPHNDNPPCVGNAVRRFKIRLNDSRWPTNEDRTKGMRKLAIAQLGSNEIDQKEFAKKVALKTIQRIVPLAIRYYIQKSKKTELEIYAKQCEGVTDLQKGREICLEVKSKLYADAAAYAAYAADAADAADAAAYAAAYDAAYAADAAAYDAAYAADAAAYAAAYAADAAAYADADASRLKVLTTCAELGLEVLIELKSPGCEYLDLCDKDINAVNLGTKGGKISGGRKSRASKLNGKKGGRPKSATPI